jgi:general L-amino acid transport system permease protein
MGIALGTAWLFGGPEHRGKWLILSALFPVIAYFLLWGGAFGLEPVASSRFGGFLLTVIIGVTGIAASLPIGVALALGRRSDMFFIRSIAVMFIEFIRGVPLITLLFVASTLLNYFLPPGTEFDLILRVLIMVTFFASAYMAEVIRGGLAALPKGQYEAADAMGLTYWQSMRLIILPQALKISIPGIVNTFIGLFKDTTLVAVIGLLDPLGLTNPIRADSNWNGVVWELYGFIGFVFFVFCWGMSRYSMFLERKLRAGDRR